MQFKDRRILVTGAGQGMGRELAKVLATRTDAKVFALSQSSANLESLKRECPAINTVCADLRDWNATKTAVEAILPIDGLVNNAGVAHMAPFLDITPDEFDSTFEVNVKAVINVSQVVARSMKESGKPGTIVNLSSQDSQGAAKEHGVYCGSKAAVDMITKVMALELGPFKIRVNAVNPTVVLTEMGKKHWSSPEKAAPLLTRIPMGKFAEIENIIHPILFLLSDKSDMINGVTLPVDGGFLAC